MSDTRFVAVEHHNSAVGPYAEGWSWKCCAYPCREMGNGFASRKAAGVAGSAHLAAVHPKPDSTTPKRVHTSMDSSTETTIA